MEGHEQFIEDKLNITSQIMHMKPSGHGMVYVVDFSDSQIRVLYIENQLASAINKETLEVALGYQLELVKDVDSLKKNEKVLCIGHGAGVLPLQAAKKGCHIVSLDLIPELFEISKKYFFLEKYKDQMDMINLVM